MGPFFRIPETQEQGRRLKSFLVDPQLVLSRVNREYSLKNMPGDGLNQGSMGQKDKNIEKTSLVLDTKLLSIMRSFLVQPK